MKFIPVSAILQAAALLLAIGSPGLSSHAQTSPKTFNYDVLTAGDCVLEQGTLSFSPTGEGRWRATIHTNHTTNRDIWHMSFNVLDAAGHQVFPVFIGDSPPCSGLLRRVSRGLSTSTSAPISSGRSIASRYGPAASDSLLHRPRELRSMGRWGSGRTPLEALFACRHVEVETVTVASLSHL